MDGIVCVVVICLPIDSNHCRQSSFSPHLFIINSKIIKRNERNDCVPSVLLPQPILCTSRVELILSCDCPTTAQYVELGAEWSTLIGPDPRDTLLSLVEPY